MAPAQTEFTEQERAAVKELIGQAVGAAAAVKKTKDEGADVVKTLGVMYNRHKDEDTSMGLYDSKNWSGCPAEPPYPEVLEWSDDYHVFQHNGTLPGGSKGGLVYTDGTDSTARRWVVAFDAISKKVFVDAGPIGPTDWEVVEVKLDAAKTYYHEFVDPIFGGKAYAEIHPDSEEGVHGYNSMVVVVFFD